MGTVGICQNQLLQKCNFSLFRSWEKFVLVIRICSMYTKFCPFLMALIPLELMVTRIFFKCSAGLVFPIFFLITALFLGWMVK